MHIEETMGDFISWPEDCCSGVLLSQRGGSWKDSVVYCPWHLGRSLLPLLSPCEAGTLVPVSSLRPPIQERGYRGEPLWGAGALEHMRYEGERKQLGCSACKSDVGKEGPDCSLALNKRRTMRLLRGTQWRDNRQPLPAAGNKIWTWGNSSKQERLRSGRGCPERSRNFHVWRFSELSQAKSGLALQLALLRGGRWARLPT